MKKSISKHGFSLFIDTDEMAKKNEGAHIDPLTKHEVVEELWGVIQELNKEI